MKIFITACAAFAASVFIAVFSLLYTSKALDSVVNSLVPLPATIEEGDKKTSEEILGCLDKTENLWDGRSAVLSFFISHRDLDEIDVLLATLRSSVESDDSGHYASTLATLRERLEKLSVSEGISALSIL